MKNKSQNGSILSSLFAKVAVVCTAAVATVISIFNPNYSNVENTEKVVEEKSFISQVTEKNYGDYVDLGTNIFEKGYKLNNEEIIRSRLENFLYR